MRRHPTVPVNVARISVATSGTDFTESEADFQAADFCPEGSHLSRGSCRSWDSAWSAFVKVCGCRPHDGGAAHTGACVRNPPREETAGCRARCRVRRYGDLTAVVPECEYNFCDMARTLRMGENAFRHPCNFKELRVVKRAHITTCALCA